MIDKPFFSGTKHDGGKTPLHLLPPDSMWAIADVLAFGQKKYDSWNWYGGIKWSRLFSACLRHLWQWWRGEDKDPESGLSHLAHAGCCLMFLLQFVLENRAELDDRPTKFKEFKSILHSEETILSENFANQRSREFSRWEFPNPAVGLGSLGSGDPPGTAWSTTEVHK